MTGIDISQWQVAIPPGRWDSILVRVSHDATGIDERGPEHFANALHQTSVRGIYHFWNPTVSSGHDQAILMAGAALRMGFRKGVDLWALDCEKTALGSPALNAAWVRDFFATAAALLGGRCLLYIGWPFYVEHFGTDLTLLREHAWWLPSYGDNDGTVHEPTCPFPPVLHQYTSRGGPNLTGLDLNRVIDAVGWQRLVSQSAPAPAPSPLPKVPPVIKASHPPVDVKVVDGKPIVLTSDGGIFAPEGGFCGTPVGQAYWHGQTASALAIKGDPKYPLTAAEVAAGKKYAVIAASGARYAY